MLILSLAFATAIVASVLITPIVVRAAHTWRLFDDPTESRRVHSEPIPRLGGIAVLAATLFSLLAVTSLPLAAGPPPITWGSELTAVLLAGVLLFAVGVWDDLAGLQPSIKFASQVLAAVLVFQFGFQIQVLSFGPTREIDLGWLALPVTVFWVVAVTNAFNLIDGLDGLATGIAIVALATVVGVALALGNLEVALISMALCGALFGFLRFNFSPARIFLGDSGSLFIGFMLAVLSVHGSMKSAATVLVIVPLLVLAVPLFDTSLAVLRRWLRGAPLSGADARHIHHRLISLGLTHRRAALVLYAAAALLASLGVLLAFAPPRAVSLIALAGGGISVGLLLYGMRRLDYHEFVEAGAVMVGGVFRMRRVIQDQIHARDLAAALSGLRSLNEIDARLRESATQFGFLGLELCRETSSRRGSAVARARAWKLDYPVYPNVATSDDPFVLRIWCGEGSNDRPYGAERVARILAPAIEAWLQVQVADVHAEVEVASAPLGPTLPALAGVQGSIVGPPGSTWPSGRTRSSRDSLGEQLSPGFVAAGRSPVTAARSRDPA